MASWAGVEGYALAKRVSSSVLEAFSCSVGDAPYALLCQLTTRCVATSYTPFHPIPLEEPESPCLNWAPVRFSLHPRALARLRTCFLRLSTPSYLLFFHARGHCGGQRREGDLKDPPPTPAPPPPPPPSPFAPPCFPLTFNLAVPSPSPLKWCQVLFPFDMQEADLLLLRVVHSWSKQSDCEPRLL